MRSAVLKQAGFQKVYESYEEVGTLLPELAKELGVSDQVKIVAGAGDNAAAAVGTGTVGDGACNISLGTSGTVFISSDKFGVDENNALHSFDHADGSYHLMGCMLSAASCNKWWMDDIIGTKGLWRRTGKYYEAWRKPCIFPSISDGGSGLRTMIRNARGTFYRSDHGYYQSGYDTGGTRRCGICLKRFF